MVFGEGRTEIRKLMNMRVRNYSTHVLNRKADILNELYHEEESVHLRLFDMEKNIVSKSEAMDLACKYLAKLEVLEDDFRRLNYLFKRYKDAGVEFTPPKGINDYIYFPDGIPKVNLDEEIKISEYLYIKFTNLRRDFIDDVQYDLKIYEIRGNPL